MAKENVKILIIDDSNTNVVLLEAVFSGKGYQVETALNAHEALKSMEVEIPDLILLDLLMPKISGFDFMETINKIDKFKGIPVIVISAVSDYDNVQKIKKMGIYDYIKKPVDIEELEEKVENLLNYSRVKP
jgi:two-component system, cell cycle response regulator DivK